MLLVPFFQNVAADFKAAAAAAFSVDAIDVAGSNDYLTRGADLTGLADGKAGTLSVWVRVDGGDTAQRVIFILNSGTGTSGLACQLLPTTNKLDIAGRNAAGTVILQMRTTPAYAAGTTWLNILASWDLAGSVNHLYVNDAAPALDIDTATDDTIDYTKGNAGVAARTDGSFDWNGCIAEVFFHTTYIDLSSEANRRLFISATGKAVDLGADGSTPLGVQPLVYLHLNDAQDPTEFAVNLGTGGSYANTGTIETCDSSPLD